jgi:hypothetical protein
MTLIRPLKNFAIVYHSVILFQLIMIGCGQSPSASVPMPSPNGRLLLKSSINENAGDPVHYLCVIVEIQDLFGNTLFREITPASDMKRWSVRWVNNKTIVLDSSGMGKYVIRRTEGNRWIGGFEKPNPRV